MALDEGVGLANSERAASADTGFPEILLIQVAVAGAKTYGEPFETNTTGCGPTAVERILNLIVPLIVAVTVNAIVDIILLAAGAAALFITSEHN